MCEVCNVFILFEYKKKKKNSDRLQKMIAPPKCMVAHNFAVQIRLALLSG